MKNEDVMKYLEDMYEEEMKKYQLANPIHKDMESEYSTDLDSSILNEFWKDFDKDDDIVCSHINNKYE